MIDVTLHGLPPPSSGGMVVRFQEASLSCLVAASAILAEMQEETLVSLAAAWQDKVQQDVFLGAETVSVAGYSILRSLYNAQQLSGLRRPLS